MSDSTPTPFRAAIPAAVWARSGRPRWATAIRVYIAFTLIWIGFFYEAPLPRWGFVAVGVLSFLLFPVIVGARLRSIEREVDAADRSDASRRLGALRQRRIVRTFAPHGWRTAHEGKLLLAAGEGKAAAKAFAETGRLGGDERAPGLLTAQVHALLLSGDPADRSAAAELSAARAEVGAPGPWDQLHCALLGLLDGRSDDGAIDALASARAALGDHPWILAGQVLALTRADRLEEAEALRPAAEAAADDLAGGLLKRADKSLRSYRKAKAKEARKKEKERAVPAKRRGDDSPAKAKADDRRSPQGSKKARKQARREARRQARAEERRRRADEAARRQRERARRPTQGAAPLQAEPPAEKRPAEKPVAVTDPPVRIEVETPEVVATPEVVTSPRPTSAPGIVLPPLVRGGTAPPRAPGRRPLRATPRPITPRPFAPRAATPTPRPPRFNLPRLLGRTSRPSPSGGPPPPPPNAASSSTRVPSGPLPTRTRQPPTIEELDEGWGDLDRLFDDNA